MVWWRLCGVLVASTFGPRAALSCASDLLTAFVVGDAAYDVWKDTSRR